MPSYADSIDGGGVWAFHEDPLGRIWMGTWGAGGHLNVFDKSTGRFSRPFGAKATEHNPGLNVRAISEGPDGSLWFGTWGNGLQRYDRRSNTLEYFYEQEGLASNFVKGLAFDERGILWISTERGISRFDPNAREFRTYSIDDGLQGDMFLSGAVGKGRNGFLYFGGDRGLNFFHPDSTADDLQPPAVVITKFSIFDKEQPPSLWQGKTIELQSSQDFISFEFVGPDFTNPARNHYAYMLEGFDRDWIQAGTRRYAGYTHLDGGTYTFRVRASNSDGVWSEEGASLQIVIHPPFWRTWWFFLGTALVVLGAISGGFQIRLRHRIALERLRLRIASDLHDDVGTELSKIVLGSQYLARTLPLKESDRTQVEMLGIIARNSHEMMRDIVWMLRSDNETLGDLAVKMREVASRLLAGIHYSVVVPTTEKMIPLAPETKRSLFLFYKECLNNIIRHRGLDPFLRAES